MLFMHSEYAFEHHIATFLCVSRDTFFLSFSECFVAMQKNSSAPRQW